MRGKRRKERGFWIWVDERRERDKGKEGDKKRKEGA